MPEIAELIPVVKDVPYCCSLKLLYSIGNPQAVEKALLSPPAKYYGNSIPVIFADNHRVLDLTPEYKQLYGGADQGGHYIAGWLRKQGYRVDEVFLGDGAHGGEMSLFIWWPKDKSEGKKPSRIWNREMAKGKVKNEKEKPHSTPEPGPAKGTRAKIAGRIRRLRRLVPGS